MDVSVAIAAFNGERYLEQQLRSISTQTAPAFEIVVSDDASSDLTSTVVEKFEAKAGVRVRLLRQARLGAFNNFSAAIDACRGTLIAYCDQDDVWETTKLEKVLPYFTDSNITLVAHSSRICDEALVPTGEVVPSELPQGRYERLFVPSRFWCWGHQMVFHRDVWFLAKDLLALPQIAGSGITSTHDFLIPFCAGLLGTCIHLDDALTLFRRHRGSLTLAGTASGGGRSGLRGKFMSQAYGATLEQSQLSRWIALLESPEVSGVVTLHLGMRYASTKLAANASLADYLIHQKNRLRWVTLRHRLYSIKSRRHRLQAFGNMIRYGAYGDPLTGRLPIKLLALDGLRAFVS